MHFGTHTPFAANSERKDPRALGTRYMDGGSAAPPALLVASGKGGVGTSLMAALHALAAAARGDRVLLVDATETGGTLHHLFGARPPHSLWMLTDERSHPADVLIPVDQGVTLVAGGTSGAALTPATDHERRQALKRLAQVYFAFDLIVFDGGSRPETIAAISEIADPTLLLVTSADRLALAANFALLKTVRARGLNARVRVLANRQNDTAAREACDFLVGAASHFLGRSIDVVGVIPDDPGMHAAIEAGMTLRDSLEDSTVIGAVRAVVSHLFPSRRTSARACNAAATIYAPSPSTRRWS
jgi:MinD-like ATPase involved in chromosome partitioning or flagellar assembly